MFHPTRELCACPFANFNVIFAKFSSVGLQGFCSIRELDPIDELASEHELEARGLYPLWAHNPFFIAVASPTFRLSLSLFFRASEPR